MRNRLPLKRRQILLLALLFSIASAALFCLLSAYERCSEQCRSFNAELCASAPLGLLNGFSSALPTDRLSAVAQRSARIPARDTNTNVDPASHDRLHSFSHVSNKINEQRESRETDSVIDDSHLVVQVSHNIYDGDEAIDEESAAPEAVAFASPNSDSNANANSNTNTNENENANTNTLVRGLRTIDCVINDEYTVGCVADLRKRLVFVPFSFIERYFEIGGRLDSAGSRFEWSHSGVASGGSTLVRAFPRYSVHGAFMNFASYNVEARERVLCVTADGVPMSTQWNARGHLYPVQIAQFGLSHFSRLFDTKSSQDALYANAIENCITLRSFLDVDQWRLAPSQRPRPSRVQPLVKVSDGVAQFDAPNMQLTSTVPPSPDSAVLRELTFEYRFMSDEVTSFNVTLLLNAKTINAVDSNEHDTNTKAPSTSHLSITYSVWRASKLQDRIVRVGTMNSTLVITYFVNSECDYNASQSATVWCVFSRNLLVDSRKALAIHLKHGPVTISATEWSFGAETIPPANGYSTDLTVNQSTIKLQQVVVQTVSVSGSFALRNVQLCDSSAKARAEMFMNSVRWFVRKQDTNGGWPVSVSRKFPFETLNPPWYSAMAHGQALSLLVRGYFHTNDERYLHVALKCISLFTKSSTDGGFQAVFMGKFVWFEEYPTTNATFVLNGFVYSLLGLFDLREALRAVSASMQLRKPGPDRVSASSFESNKLDEHLRTVSSLYEEGLVALKALLPLFDSGSGSFYDLRHVTMPMLSPNIARWDYHTTHINQLNILYTIEKYEPFKRTAERWADYMKGKRSPHN